MRRTDLTAVLALFCACSGERAGSDASSDAAALPADLMSAMDGATVADAGTTPDVGTPRDSAPDVGSPDAGSPDTTVADADSTVNKGPCSAGAFVIQSFGPKMKTCFSWTQFVNQCEAGALCGSGWHNCAASEFRQHGGATTPALPQAWIAGCVRLSGPPTQPQDSPCPCVLVQAPSADVVAPCAGSPGGSWVGISNYNIGIVTDMSCHRLGKGAQNEAYWNATVSASKLPGATCCPGP